jgi:SMODS and SLOG-associating 2TM effector domain 6
MMMDKDGLLICVAETGYNVGFGAKKNFATHDMVQKAPGLIGFLSLAIGIFALIIESLSSKFVGATLAVLGVASLYITHYDHNKNDYSKEGERLTALFTRLRNLYREVKALSNTDDLTAPRQQLDAIEQDFYSTCVSKQILFSNWYAHYKFFWEQQIDWIDEQKKFTFWRDKVPLSLTFAVATLLLSVIGTSIYFLIVAKCTFAA